MPEDVHESDCCGPRYLKRSSLPNRHELIRGFVERHEFCAFGLYRPGPGFSNRGRSGSLKAPGGGAQVPERGLGFFFEPVDAAYGDLPNPSAGAEALPFISAAMKRTNKHTQ